MSSILQKSEAFLGSEIFHNFKGNYSAIFGSVIIGMFVFIVALGPLLVHQDPYDIASLELLDAYKPPVWLDGGEVRFLLGTDGQGRDVLAAIIYGTRISLLISLAAMICSSVIGSALGLVAGYYGGRWDGMIMRVADVQLSFPSLLIALFLMSAFGNGLGKVLISLTCVGWVIYARTVRGSTLSEKQKEYVQAAQAAGLPNHKIIVRHILPNVLTPLIVVGVPISQPSLGLLVKNGFDVLLSGLWWTSVFPGAFIMLLVFGINLLGDFLRDELNPRLR
jgi:peptide/nickel transport system permease protein